ncbi:MAG: 4Fe-4S binding protein [candidate division Zixibacteria bacterium]|nr:4Fe-4S binding protein [candidate division Zixibacteria bacterium]
MTIQHVRNIRRTVQAVVLILFLVLLLKTEFAGTFSADALKDYRLAYPVKIFLQFDPLASFMTAISSLTLFSGLMFSLILIVLTIFFGRFFCGWICPMGTVNQLCSTFKSERRSRLGKNLIKSNQYHWYQKIKYYILIFFIGSAFLGLMIAGIFDPISLLIRSIGLVVIPIIFGILDFVADFSFNNNFPGNSALGFISGWIQENVLITHSVISYNTIFSLGLFFLLILAANRWFTRFWCRGLCPLGAFLGLISRWSIFGMEKSEDQCDLCNKCLKYCQGADGPQKGVPWRKSECHLCLNCQTECDRGAIKFKFFPKSQDKIEPKPNITRRKVIASAALGVGAVALFKSQPASAKPNDKLIRPPGSTKEDLFMARCIRCGECMKVCPTNAIHPTFMEAGWEGIWSPILIMRIGYCEPSCTLCGQVCPTGAIKELTLEEKVGSKEVPADVIGTAFVDQGRCLPWSMATPCVVCEEWCPTSPKAIYTEKVKVKNQKGETVEVQRPHVDPALCTGCGACEYACPVADKAAIRVTSVGESRSKENRIILEDKRGSSRS